MKVITLNLNGIRAAAKKGVFEWLAEQSPDIICLQEVRATLEQFPKELKTLERYHQYWSFAEKAGYSGVGVLSLQQPVEVYRGFGSSLDLEGRLVRIDTPNTIVVSAYFPSGTSGTERQAQKMQFLQEIFPYLMTLKASGKEVLLCGDVNIAHRPIDLKNWRGNQTNSGFLPEERAWLDQLLEGGFVDVYRQLIGPDTPEYSWWSNRGNARANNVGWRIDYQFATSGLASRAMSGLIERERTFSDHAAVVVQYGA